MNRAERRAMEKRFKAQGMTKTQAKEAVANMTAKATIQLDDGTEKVVDLGNVASTEDPSIMEKINKALEE